MIMDDKLIDTAEEFLEFFLRDPRFRTPNHHEASQTGKGSMIFRGQSDAKWGLVPTAFRLGRPFLDFTSQAPMEIPRENQEKEYLGLHLFAELRSVFLFLESADQLGIPTPLDFTTLNEGMGIIKAALANEDYDYSEQFPPKKYEASVALAQHYGVPTRFLDWTPSPLIACYFAAYDASIFAKEAPAEGQEIAVYFLSRHSISNSESPISVVKTPKYQNDHIRAQQGLFTSFNSANEYFLKNKEWPDLKKLASHEFQVFRRRLPASEADDLLRYLFDLDITRERLMPSLTNAAQSYQYKKALFDKRHVPCRERESNS